MNLTPDPTIIGVIGGGQLCRMMCEAATPLGFEIVFLDPTSDAPASPVARDQIVGDFDDDDAVRRLIARSDVLTYDIELADPNLIERINPGIPVHPHPETLAFIQDKLVQKNTLSEAGIPVPPYLSLESREDLDTARERLGLPLMLKSRTGGYDGRGNAVLTDPEAFEGRRRELNPPLMAEELLDFDRELSVMGVKHAGGIDTYPVTETIHEEEILRRTVTPARASEDVLEKARSVAESVLQVVEGRGVYGIELFERHGEIMVNEIAPRPHNSGHWTIEGTETSQFEQHLRAVAGVPAGSTDLRSPAVTVNILGDKGERDVDLRGVSPLLEHPRAHLHWYGKKHERPLRKMGHFTLTGADRDALLASANQLHERLAFHP